MPDHTASSPTPTAVSRDVLLGMIAEAVVTVPGVVRLEPTLSTSGPRLLLRRGPTDGIRLLIRAGTLHVDLNVATSASCPARTVAHQVQASTTEVLAAHGYPSSSITVSVLTIEPSTGA